MLKKKVDPPQGVRGYVFHLVNHRIFDAIITFFILFNTILMAVKYDGMDQSLENLLVFLNYIFALVFNLEMILKLIGLDKQYFYDSWNLFDMLIVIGTNFGIIMSLLNIGKGF